jgi:hypothetical protein
MIGGLRTWDAQARLQLDTSTFTYQIVASVLVDFAATPIVNIPITGDASNHCAVVLALTGGFMPKIAVQLNNIQINGGRVARPVARVLVMKFRPSAGAAGTAGSYGFMARNNDGFVQIDAETPRLSVACSGLYQGTSMTVTVGFPQPITTEEPPCVFIRPSTTTGTELYYQMEIIGTARNWTGFRLTSRNVNFYPSGKWFAAVFAATTSDSYGVRFWDGASRPVYDTGSPPVVVTNVLQSWPYAGVSGGTLANNYYWRIPYAVAEDEYVMINSFTLPAMSETSPAASPTSISLNYAGGYVEMYQQAPAGTVHTNKGNVPAVFARLFIA